MKRFIILVMLVCFVSAFAFSGGGTESGSETTSSGTGATGAGGFNEAPMLASRVQSGDLPAVNERLPKEPLVITQERSAAPDGFLEDLQIGKYGGTLRMINIAPGFGPEMYFMTIEPILARPGWASLGHPLTPNILKDYEISADKRIFTLYMREGMKWSDGAPLTTEDVLFYYEDILLNEELTPNVGSSHRSELMATGDVYKLDVIDDYSYRITFTKPTPGFLDEINKPWMDYTGFLQPKHYLQQFHKSYADADALAKEIKDAELLAEEWTRLFQMRMLTPWEAKTPEVMDCPTLHPWIVVNTTATTVTFERNPYYFKVDTAGNQLPYVDKIVATKVEGSESATLKIIAGEVDIADELAKISDYPLYKENENRGYKVLAMNQPFVAAGHAFNFTYDDPVWRQVVNDLRFRQALSFAINRDEIIDAVYYGLASKPVWNNDEYSPSKAKQLLDDMGLDKKDADGWRLGPDGERFELNIDITAHLPDTVPIFEIVNEHYKAVGLFTSINTIDVGLLGQRRGGNQLIIDTFWQEATTLHAFGHAKWHLTAPNPLWNQWYNSGGTDGEEPPTWFKDLYQLGISIGPGIPWDDSVVAEYQRQFYENIPQINIVEDSKTSVIAHAKLGNVFTGGVGQWLIYSAEQLYYND